MNKTDIKNDIKTRLTGKTLAGSNISVDKVLSHQMTALPAIAIYIPNSGYDNQNPDESGVVLITTHNIVLDLIVSQSTNYSSDLDTLEQQVIETLIKDRTFLAQFEQFIGIDSNVTLDDAGERPTATAEITISVLTVDSYQAV